IQAAANAAFDGYLGYAGDAVSFSASDNVASDFAFAAALYDANNDVAFDPETLLAAHFGQAPMPMKVFLRFGGRS
ncbi:hypothetical protein, partial [Leisingera sp. MMG026]|uniref:hypothetical protein n=1 Tax=Leisingera sp. MMG026 TaxID=2909982 RepID=UPI001F2AB216